MEDKQITSFISLGEWLESQSQTASISIAHRSALRVMPLSFWHSVETLPTVAELTLVVLRGLLTSGVGTQRFDSTVDQNYALAASNAAYALDVVKTTDTEYMSDLNRGLGSARAATRAAARATYATAAISSDAQGAAFSSVKLRGNQVELGGWHPIRQDAAALQSGTDPLTLPLWPDTPPDWFTTADAVMRTFWQTNNPTHWDFWQRWYDAAIAGRPLDWQLQHAIALIPDDIWQSGPGPVADAIARIEADHLAARTNNGERLEINPATGLIRLVPETDLPADIATYATRKMAKALAIFDTATDNQHRPLEPAFKVIRDALDDATNLPVELFDACASATRLVATLVRNQSVPSPEQDAKINEFVTLLREAGADILANDPKTQDVLTRRNNILGNNALVENAEAIRFVVQQVITISEGTLVRAMPRDVEIATQTKGDVAEVKNSAFRLVSRILRYKTVWAIAAVPATGAFIDGAEKIYATWQWIISTPQFQLAWTAILRWVGFA